MLLFGPPGTGKSALCRVLAAELAGDVTVVFCDARAIGAHMGAVYQELTRLAPALVVLEDLDLVVGNRRSGREGGGLHDFLTALDGVMSSHDGIVTIATTNDVKALDDAAVRAARFDRIIEIPLPDAGLRASILRRYLGELCDAIDVNAVAAATDGASGAGLRELVRRAVLVDGEGFTTATLLRLAREGLGATRTGQYL
jgi:AAA+ superfamily predicted ATPase